MLKMVLDSLDGISEDLKKEYIFKNGKYELQVDDVVARTAYSDTMNTLQKERDLHDATKKKVAEWNSLGEIDTVRTKLNNYGELDYRANQGNTNIEELREKIRTSIVNEHNSELEKKDKEINELQGTVNNLKATASRNQIKNDLLVAASEHKVVKSALEDVTIYGDMIFEVNDNGHTVTKDKGLTPNDWLAEVKGNKPHWFGTSVGGGASGSGNTVEENVFLLDKGKPRYSPEARAKIRTLVSQDSAKAEKMAKDAGVSIDAVVPPQ